MAFVLMLVWIVAGVFFLGHQLVTGRTWMVLNTGIPGWVICFAFAVFNYARWYASTAGKDDEEAVRIASEARKRQARQRERPDEYDPNLDFSRKDDPPADSPR